VEPGEREKEGTGDEGLGDLELGVESSEWEIQDESGSNEAGFFYEEEEEQEDETIGIGARVAVRTRGRLHNGRGQMEQGMEHQV